MNPWDLSCRSSSSSQPRAPTLAFGRPPLEHHPQQQPQPNQQRKHQHFHLEAPAPQPPPPPRLAYLSYQQQQQPPQQQLAAHALTSIHQLVAAPPAAGSPPSFCSLASSPNSTRSNSIEASSCCDDIRVAAKARPLANGADLMTAHATWTTPMNEKTMTITHPSNETAAFSPPPPLSSTTTTTSQSSTAPATTTPAAATATTTMTPSTTTTNTNTTTTTTTTTTLGLDKKARKKDQNRRAAYNYRRKKMEERNRIREEEMRLVYSRVCLIGYVEELESSIMYILNTKTRRILDKNGNTNCFLCPICLQSCDNTLNLRSHLNLLHNQLDSH